MQYTANITWQRNAAPFDVKSFDRTHTISFGSGTDVQGSSAPEFMGNAALVNPEELFTASISSCFMLTLLYWAASRKIIIEGYTAKAIGKLGKSAEGKMVMTEVIIKPSIRFENDQVPDAAVLNDLFKKAHDNCFISSSVKTKVTIESEQVAVS
jgi:organic hydroperoxide reductase OsmC/OhrA